MKIITLRYGGLFLAVVATLLFTGYSSGPALNQAYNTGAPSTGGGTESTCSSCHNGGNFGEPQLNVTFGIDGGIKDTLAEYLPGQTYEVTVAIGYENDAPANYGFQAQILVSSDTSAAGTLATSAADGDVQISNGNLDRRYAEHNRRGPDSLFTFEWTAPEAGTGEVKMYVVGNLVNSNFGTSGDNGSTAPTVVTLNEKIDVSTRGRAQIPGALFPNPTAGPATLRVTPSVAGIYDLRLLTVDGRVLSSSTHQLIAGTTTLPIATDQLLPGLYLVELRGKAGRFVTRLVRQ
ncbi:MAG: choice-of-anchor V domain-containing protein [Bacteroidota bacterium]